MNVSRGTFIVFMAGIYIHIPFCYSRCGYCDFYKTTDLSLIENYIFSLKREIEYRSKTFNYLIETIYFGGGTPSLLPTFFWENIINTISKKFKISDNPEITIECNPDDLDFAYLTNLHEIGFNRISLGVQSLLDEDLKIMNRRHDVKQALEVVEQAASTGFDNIGVDIIYGLPWSNSKLFSENLRRFLQLPVNHFSAYHLTIEKGTAFHKRKEEGRLKELDDTQSFRQYEILCNEMSFRGIDHYEVSNFCYPEFYSRHNSSYWKGIPYIGFGAGAHSYENNRRFWNKTDLNLYNSEKFDDIHEEEILSLSDLFNEQIMLGLRTKWGVDLINCENQFGQFYESFLKTMQKWSRGGVLYIESNHLKCYEKKWFIVDKVIEDFIIV